MGVYWSSQHPSQLEPQTESQNESAQRDDTLDSDDTDARKAKREKELAKLKEDLARQRELRLKKLNQVSDEMKSLREELTMERERRERVEKQLEAATGRRNGEGNPDIGKSGGANLVEDTDRRREGVNQENHIVRSVGDERRNTIVDELLTADVSPVIPNGKQIESPKVALVVNIPDEKHIELDETSSFNMKGTFVTYVTELESPKVNITASILDGKSLKLNESSTSNMALVCQNTIINKDKTPEFVFGNFATSTKQESTPEKKNNPNVTTDLTSELTVEGTSDKLKELGEMKEVVKDMFEKNQRLESQVKALKDVANIGKELLKIREIQVSELNNKLKTIEETGVEYEKEVATMRKLKGLYEERARASEAEHKVELEREKARTTVFQVKLRLSEETNGELSEKIQMLENKVATLDSQVDQLTEKLSESRLDAATKSEKLYHVTSQMNLINSLFSQVISGPEVDFDRLATFLEENHNLINEITTKGDLNNVATLAGLTGGVEECLPNEQQNEIATNLGKVWRILVELLSHQTKTPNSQEWESCYKSVETPKGPKVVISVSRTFIKLKDLILEKNSLVKEVSRLKKLNHHLENKMEEQENRLTIVTAELHNTWGVVNKLRTQHENLHTHEKILRYELQHKRMMLNDLKKQLEVCREQWAQAREKNTQTEKDWKQLRAEFAQRKRQQHGSAESGYEDEQSPDETDEEKSYAEDKSQGKHPDEEDLSHAWNETENGIQEATSEKVATDFTPVVIEEKIDQEEVTCDHGILKETGNMQQDILPGESSTPTPETPATQAQELKSPVDIWKMLEKREERLMRMEGQTRVVLDQMNNTSQRGEAIGNKLDELHETYRSCSDSLIPKTDLTEERLKEESCDSNLKPIEDTSVRITETSFSEHQPNHPPPDRPSTSSTSFSMEEHLRQREERLKRMEQSCKSLFAKMGQTSDRSSEIANRLDEIHAQHSQQEDDSKPDSNKESDQEST